MSISRNLPKKRENCVDKTMRLYTCKNMQHVFGRNLGYFYEMILSNLFYGLHSKLVVVIRKHHYNVHEHVACSIMNSFIHEHVICSIMNSFIYHLNGICLYKMHISMYLQIPHTHSHS